MLFATRGQVSVATSDLLCLVVALRLAVGWGCGGRGWFGAGVMSMRPMPWPEVPEQTARVARAAVPKGSLAIRLRDEPGPISLDADFVGAFGCGTGRGSRHRC